MNRKVNYLPVSDSLSSNLQKQDPWKPLNSFHISSITLQNDSFRSELINLMDNGGKLEPLFKAIEENHKENSYVTKVFEKYLPFIYTVDNVLKIKFKNKVLLVVPKWCLGYPDPGPHTRSSTPSRHKSFNKLNLLLVNVQSL